MKFNSTHNTTKKILIASIAVVVVLVGLNLAALWFIQETGASVGALEGEVSSLQTQVLEFSKYKSEDLKALAQSVDSHFISQDDLVKFIESVEVSGRQQGLSITVSSVDAQNRGDNASDDKQIVVLRLETNGSWQNTMRFVNLLEHLPYKINIRNLVLSVVRDNGAQKTPSWRGQIEVTALKFK